MRARRGTGKRVSSRNPKRLLACVVVALVCGGAWGSKAPAAPLAAQDRIDAIASVFANRTATIKCVDPNADQNLANAWGYTYLVWDFAVLDGTLCDALATLAGVAPAPWVDAPHPPTAGLMLREERPAYDFGAEWKQAMAVLVLVHEATHVRSWKWRGDEGRVECLAVRHWRFGAQMIGLDAAGISRLYGWALAMHWRIAAIAPAYNYAGCNVPNPF